MAKLCDSPYMEHQFALDQQRWRHEKRFLVMCSESSGFGAYLKGMVSAVYAAILTERAILLQGCTEPHSGGQVEKYIHEYFRGRRFDWENNNLSAKVSHSIRVNAGSCGRPCIYNWSYAASIPTPSHATVMLFTNEHTGPDKMLQRFPGPAFSRLKEILMWRASATVSDKWGELHSCALSAMLTPTVHLAALESAFVQKHGVERLPDGALNIRLMHARLGDGSMHAAEGMHWKWANEKRCCGCLNPRRAGAGRRRLQDPNPVADPPLHPPAPCVGRV